MKPSWSRTVAREFLIVIAPIALLLSGAWLYGAYRWNAGTRALHARLDAAREPIRPRSVDFRELEGLPAPVERYFRLVLNEGQSMVSAVRVRHAGTFNTGETVDRWKPFASDQKVVARRPGFDWNATVAVMPGLPVRVHDSYAEGEGVLHASVLGLFTVSDMRGAGEVAEGELMRFFAEAPWYPTALLPSQSVRWEVADGERSAYATLSEGCHTVRMRFAFDERGHIETVRAESRGRAVGGEIVPTPWEGRFWNYRESGGMLVPMDGEVAWLPPEGEKPYWRGRIIEISHEFER